MTARRSTVALLGAVLVAAAAVGFVTVADDPRHAGELFAVLGIFIAGLALLADRLFPRAASALSFRWLPIGIACGGLVGAVFDEVVLGVSLGLVLGILLGRIHRVPK